MLIIVKFGGSSLRRKQFLFTWDKAHLRQECHNSKLVILQEKSLKVLKCCNFLSATAVQWLVLQTALWHSTC